ncbi:hypothetical protein [Streptomyces sp. NPDC004296]|uniref:hypothetical protein n=1 Tax=Streptomyces sp. NPDC004296 TaxID=3364697 RepID=UPI0036A461A4
MFSRKKIAAVVALMGGLTAAGFIAPQAHAEGESHCSRGEAGDRTCVNRHEAAYRTKDGDRVIIDQTQRCSTIDRERVVWPESGTTDNQSTEIGPRMNCSNQFPLPKELQRQSADS